MPESILEEANRLVNGDRKDTYDGTDDTIVALWSAYLGVELTVLDYAAMMVLLKVARTKGKLHHDSWVDIAGYAEVGPRLWEAKQEPKLGELTPEKTGEPRVWDSIADVPTSVRVVDGDADPWEFREGHWHYRMGRVDTWYRASKYLDEEADSGPFTEVIGG